nr:MAG TPA: DNA polymerase II small subunit [Caudoviricetes sp.]
MKNKEVPYVNFHMDESENLEHFIWRLGQAKDSGILDMSWDDIADVINKEIGNEDMPFSSSAFRKPYQQAKRFYDAGVFGEISDGKYLKELQSQKQELEKQKVKVRDERNELKRVIREEARKESFKDQVLRSIAESDCHPLLYDEMKKFDGVLKSDNDLIISMTDLHTGIEIDNYFNKFNEDVLRERMNNYLDKIFEVQLRHGSENAHVILSELVSGIIHTELRIENNQNLIDQFLTAANYISQFLSELSYRFEEVNVYMCPGNHSRISPKKEDSLKGENIDHLAIPFLEAKLQNFENITFHNNNIEESIAMFSVRGNIVMASHGDKDSPGNVVQKFTLMFGMRPALVYLGHRHTNAMTTVYDTKVIQSGCMSGSDNYCMDKRLKNKPEQTISVVTENGLECLYDMKF